MTKIHATSLHNILQPFTTLDNRFYIITHFIACSVRYTLRLTHWNRIQLLTK
jgi:hypothetical protein